MEYSCRKKKTKREEFLEIMDEIIPWDEWVALIVPHYPARNELERGTPPRRSSKGKAPGYSPKCGEAVYKAHRVNNCKPRKADSCKPFIAWVVKQVREHKWPLDACCGYAKRQCLFSENEMVCTHTLYNMVWDGRFPIKVTELPEALKRKGRKS